MKRERQWPNHWAQWRKSTKRNDRVKILGQVRGTARATHWACALALQWPRLRHRCTLCHCNKTVDKENAYNDSQLCSYRPTYLYLLFIVYLTTQSIAETIYHRIIAWLSLMNDVEGSGRGLFQAQPCYLPGGLKKITKKPIRITDLRIEIWRPNLKKTKMKCYKINRDVGILHFLTAKNWNQTFTYANIFRSTWYLFAVTFEPGCLSHWSDRLRTGRT